MKLKTIALTLLLIAGHFLAESAELIERIYPRSKTIVFDHFIAWKWPWPAQPMTLNWWIKHNTEEFLWCCTFFVLAQIAKHYSWRMFLVAFALFIYHCFDWFMLWYDYKQSHFMYWIGLSVLMWCVGCVVVPSRMKVIR